MQRNGVRFVLTVLAFSSILIALTALPQKGLQYWYLFFSPMVLAASFFGLRGAVVTSGAAMVSVLMLYQRSSAVLHEYGAAAGAPLGQLSVPAIETYGHAVVGMVMMSLGALGTGLLSDRRPGVLFGSLNDALVGRAALLSPENLRAHLDGLVRHAAAQKRCGAVLVAFFPGFTRLVQELGPASEDVLYRQVESRLQTHLRGTDVLCRLESGELAVVLADAGRPQAEAVARRLLEALSNAPLRVGERRQVLSASVGIALYPSDAADADVLLTYAATALHHAYTDGGVYFHRPAVISLVPHDA